MAAILRAALLAVTLTACAPAVQSRQSVGPEGLSRRVENLERTTSELEGRVRELEALLRNAQARGRPVATSGNPRDLANWRRLRRGMTMDDVRALLAEPERIEAGYFTYWHYPDHARVDFTSGKVDGWSEPRR